MTGKEVVGLYTMACDSAIKNKTFPFATTWMALVGMTLSEIGQTEKDRHHMNSLICRTYGTT